MWFWISAGAVNLLALALLWAGRSARTPARIDWVWRRAALCAMLATSGALALATVSAVRLTRALDGTSSEPSHAAERMATGISGAIEGFAGALLLVPFPLAAAVVVWLRRRKLLAGVLVATALALTAPSARAWGDDGHRVVGELAWRQLSPTAQAAVAEALTERGYESLAEAATWPDTYARRFPEYDPMKPFHYVNVDAQAPSYQRERDCPNGCVVTALTQFIALLESKEQPLSLAERRRDIYWIAHFMGDIHQPLHVAHPDAKGGTQTLLGFFEAPDKRSAHWIWDFGLIQRRPEPPAARAVAGDAPLFRALADELATELTPARLRAFRAVTSPEAIANEALVQSRRYAFLKSTDHVDAAYEMTRWPVVRAQLEKAGVRLAAVLEHALGAP